MQGTFIVVSGPMYWIRVRFVEEPIPLSLITEELPVVPHRVSVKAGVARKLALVHVVHTHAAERDLGKRLWDQGDLAALRPPLREPDGVEELNDVVRGGHLERLQRGLERLDVGDPEEDEDFGFLKTIIRDYPATV